MINERKQQLMQSARSTARQVVAQASQYKCQETRTRKRQKQFIADTLKLGDILSQYQPSTER